MEKNEEFTGLCTGLGTNGEGIVKRDDGTVFVPFLLCGEKAVIRIVKSSGKIAYGKVVDLCTPSEERTRARCPVFGKCGGCRLQHMRYRLQLRFKTELVKGTLEKIGGISFEVSPCEGSEKEYGYRNKLQLPIGRVRGENAVGFYAERSHRIVKTDDCPIHPEWAKPFIAAVYRFMETCGIDGYDEETGEGELRHIVVREIRRKFLVTLVTAKEIKGIDFFVSLLQKIFREFSLYLNFHAENNNVIFGKEFRLVYGAGSYSYTENGIVCRAGASTFLQVNEGVRAKLYDRAAALVSEKETVIDCYSGGGLLTAMFARKCKKAYGIELVKEASEMADRLKEENGLKEKMVNLTGRVEELLPALIAKEKGATIVLDPPRAGVDRGVLKAILQSGAKKVIMISCNPATLARDLGILTGSLTETPQGELVKSNQERDEGFYALESVQPFDMFPQTKWVETLVELSHKKPDSHIEVKIDMDDTTLDTAAISERAEKRKPKDKPTYKKMQAWIEENYGFRVHTGYIAEVKRNEGLPMYDAPNAVEELKHPRPHPTPQMVEAIKAALKHFEII